MRAGTFAYLAFSLVLLMAQPFAHSQEKSLRLDSCTNCDKWVDEKIFASSVHGELDCVECHTDSPFKEHTNTFSEVSCRECHEDTVNAYEQSIHGKALSEGKEDAPDCLDCHGEAHAIKPQDSPDSKHSRSRIPEMCAQCHADINLVRKYDIPVADPLSLYRNSVHGSALFDGNLKAAVCSDCHGAHSIQPGRQMSSTTHKTHIPETCGRCHIDVLEDYKASVHGKALLKGITDAPMCTDCHGEHAILHVKDPKSAVSPTQMATKTCGHCHQDLTLAQRYGISASRLSSFMSSYHGMAVRRGSLTVANCGSCHGIHKVLDSSDPTSTIHPSNLKATCGHCHPGASESFARIPVHLQTSPTSAPVLFYVRIIYLWVIVLTIGLMLLHNLVIYLAAVFSKLREQRGDKTFRRFTMYQLILHGALLTTFTILVITGFGLHFPEAIWTRVLDWFLLSEEARRVLHRIAASVLLATGVLHLLHGVFTRKGRSEWKELWPRLSDMKDLKRYLGYYWNLLIGRTENLERPELGRYTYIHKMEYWALIWGTMIMSITGLALWFPVLASEFLPDWGIPLMQLIHYYEAWLATLAIFVWHFFFVIFHPDEYPMSVAWLTGRLTHEEMERDHSLELKDENKTDS